MKPWILVLMATAACGETIKGNEPTPPTCADDLKTFKACGGDVVGVWTATEACGDPRASPLASYPACAPSSWKVAIHPSGTITFAADGTETDAFDSAIPVVLALTDACYSAAFSDTPPGVEGCATLQGKLKDYVDSTDAGACSYASGTCTCQATIAVHDFKTRRYVVSGTNLTYPDEGTKPLPYCVSGGSLNAKVDGGEGAFSLYKLTRN